MLPCRECPWLLGAHTRPVHQRQGVVSTITNQMNETSLGPEGVQRAYSSHRIRSLISNGLFASSLPIQVENTGNERGVRNWLAAAGQGHQSFASKAKQSELIVCQEFRNQPGR